MAQLEALKAVLASAGDGEAGKPVFRAIRTGAGRHGIRMETAYWNAFAMIAKDCNLSSSGLLEAVIRSCGNDRSNLTARIRLFCLVWFQHALESFPADGSERLASGLVHASTQPAIALSAEKRLLATNESFLQLVRSRFGATGSSGTTSDLRLALDHPLEQVIANLRKSRNEPLQVGVAMGMSDQRVRRTMNAVLIATGGPDVVLGLIV